MLTVVENQDVIQVGPYRVIRHPMYLGSIMICAGVATSLATWPAAMTWSLPPLALLRRIGVEEHMLREALGERYEAYAASRARLVPRVW